MKVTHVSQLPTPIGGKVHSAKGGTVVLEVKNVDSLETKKVVVGQCQDSLSDQMCSKFCHDPVVECSLSAEETTVKDHHCCDLTTKDKITSTANNYDDEIWEC